ncbi:hypothetical protein [Paractinoplanes durhamensis]|uniref:hypothetical protein n=1 Tax=Paractinoplanes durhamensis TaxID=113563 RepID=UPI00364029A9
MSTTAPGAMVKLPWLMLNTTIAAVAATPASPTATARNETVPATGPALRTRRRAGRTRVVVTASPPRRGGGPGR